MTVLTAPGKTGDGEVKAARDPLPALYAVEGLQCQHTITVIVHVGPNGLELVALPSTYAGLSTKNTPDTVAYYLDQAQVRKRSVLEAQRLQCAAPRWSTSLMIKDSRHECSVQTACGSMLRERSVSGAASKGPWRPLFGAL